MIQENKMDIPYPKEITTKENTAYEREILPIFCNLKENVDSLNNAIKRDDSLQEEIMKYVKEESVRMGVIPEQPHKYSLIFWLNLKSFLEKERDKYPLIKSFLDDETIQGKIKKIKEDFFEIYDRYHDYALYIAKKFNNFNQLTDEQKEEVAIKKLEASISTFKVADDTGKKMARFATFLRNNIARELRRLQDSLYYSRGMSGELLKKIDHIVDIYKRRNEGDYPSVGVIISELSKMGINETEKHIQEIIDKRNYDGGVQRLSIHLEDILPSEKNIPIYDSFFMKDGKKRSNPEYQAQMREVLGLIKKVVESLNKKKKNGLGKAQLLILKHRLLDDNTKTLEEISKGCGVSKERVRQIQNELIKKIREILKNKGIKNFSDIF